MNEKVREVLDKFESDMNGIEYQRCGIMLKRKYQEIAKIDAITALENLYRRQVTEEFVERLREAISNETEMGRRKNDYIYIDEIDRIAQEYIGKRGD